MRLTLLVAAGVVVPGCVDAQLPSQSALDGLRVLAVRAEPAEAAPGQAIELDALVVDPGQDRPLDLAWAACLDPPGGDAARCPETGQLEYLGREPTARFTVPSDATATFVGVLLQVCAEGSALLPPVGCEESGADGLLAIRRVGVSVSPSNGNPVIESVRMNGAVLRSDHQTPLRQCLRADTCTNEMALGISAPSVETYTVAGRDRTEDLLTSWGATRGILSTSFGSGLEPTVDWRPPQDTGIVLLTFVVRDERGGVDWETREILVE